MGKTGSWPVLGGGSSIHRDLYTHGMTHAAEVFVLSTGADPTSMSGTEDSRHPGVDEVMSRNFVNRIHISSYIYIIIYYSVIMYMYTYIYHYAKVYNRFNR